MNTAFYQYIWIIMALNVISGLDNGRIDGFTCSRSFVHTNYKEFHFTRSLLGKDRTVLCIALC